MSGIVSVATPVEVDKSGWDSDGLPPIPSATDPELFPDLDSDRASVSGSEAADHYQDEDEGSWYRPDGTPVWLRDLPTQAEFDKLSTIARKVTDAQGLAKQLTKSMPIIRRGKSFLDTTVNRWPALSSREVLTAHHPLYDAAFDEHPYLDGDEALLPPSSVLRYTLDRTLALPHISDHPLADRWSGVMQDELIKRIAWDVSEHFHAQRNTDSLNPTSISEWRDESFLTHAQRLVKPTCASGALTESETDRATRKAIEAKWKSVLLGEVEEAQRRTGKPFE